MSKLLHGCAKCINGGAFLGPINSPPGKGDASKINVLREDSENQRENSAQLLSGAARDESGAPRFIMLGKAARGLTGIGLQTHAVTKPKVITPDLPNEEPDNSLSMGDEHHNTILETEKTSVKNLVPIPNNSITSPKIDFLPEEFVSDLDFIDPILPGIDEGDFDEEDFDEEEGENNNDILQIEDEILHEKLLNVNLLVDKIEALKLTPSIPFVLENPSSFIPVVDSDFLVEEVDTFLISEDSIPPSIESDLDSEGDIIFLDNLLNEDPIPEYERFNFDIEPDAPVINNFDELNEDECFDPGGEIDVEDDYSFTFVIRTFFPFLTYPVDSPLLLSTRSEDIIFDPGIFT
ncbi:hypothetical protein Tco_1081148 [Tanacetum coccineum]|uniref:Uncharacterized protein n=1 Tax=Tanacetum coccineum TaxID=301880 RepID=A0ABQ5HYQ3_9ASTR